MIWFICYSNVPFSFGTLHFFSFEEISYHSAHYIKALSRGFYLLPIRKNMRTFHFIIVSKIDECRNFLFTLIDHIPLCFIRIYFTYYTSMNRIKFIKSFSMDGWVGWSGIVLPFSLHPTVSLIPLSLPIYINIPMYERWIRNSTRHLEGRVHKSRTKKSKYSINV